MVSNERRGTVALWGDDAVPRLGCLIAICGIDGSGKSTQVGHLVRYFERAGRSVCVTKQPTDWYRSDPHVRSFLQSGSAPMSPRSLALFAAADRARHVDTVIRPALARGEVVITDRYVYSSLAYFASRGVDATFLRTINQGVLRPDFAFFLDVRPTELLRRLRIRDGEELKYEERTEVDLDRLHRHFQSMHNEFTIIDGERPPDVVAAEILASVLTTGCRTTGTLDPVTAWRREHAGFDGDQGQL